MTCHYLAAAKTLNNLYSSTYMSCDSMNIWSKSSTVTSIFSLWISSVPSKNLVNVSSSAFNTSTSRGLASVSVSELVSFVLNEGVSIAVKRFGVDDAENYHYQICY